MASENFFQSKTFKGIVLGVGGLVILMVVFGLGVYVGGERADFSFRWAEEYHNNFGGPNMPFSQLPGRDFTNANGVFGQIMQINQTAPASLTIKGSDNVEKVILIGDKTTIRIARKNVKLSDLKVDSYVVVIGNPNSSGQIQAELVRVMPSALN